MTGVSRCRPRQRLGDVPQILEKVGRQARVEKRSPQGDELGRSGAVASRRDDKDDEAVLEQLGLS